MKKINYYLGALALASLSLGACSSDKLAGEEPNGPDTKTERTVYVNIAVHGDAAGSRASASNGNPEDNATDFGDPVGNEGKVNSCYLVFYDGTGNVVGEIAQVNGSFESVAVGNGTVESRLQKVVPVTLQAGQENPTQVMCYINPANPSDLQNPLATVQTITRDAVTIPGTDGNLFPMSNSVYYDATNGLKMAVKIPAESVFTTQEAAQAALTATNPTNIIDIYVERYAAKLTMQGIATPTEYITATTSDAALGAATEVEVELNFTVDGWALNGEAKNTFAVKSFREASTDGQILPNNYTFTGLNAEINPNGGDWTWNNANFHRSYWACSPVYFQAEYPEVLNDYDPTVMNQTFLSYNDVINGKGFKADDTAPHYFKETTVGTHGLQSANPNAAVASVIIVGHYSVTVNGTPTPEPTFYTYVRGTNGNPTVYFEGTGNDAASTVAGGLSMQKRFLWQTTVLYKNTAAEGAAPNYVRMSAGVLDDLHAMVGATRIERPTDAVLGETKMASRALTLQLTGDNLTGIFINDNGTPKQIVADNTENFDEATQVKLTRANQILWQNVGSCNKYEAGAGFFNIPVKHLGYYRQSNNTTAATNAATIEVADASVGDFGMVRNHSYQINVTKIEGLAEGIGDKANPIIPPADTKDVYMAYRINVLRWAIVPVQNVEL
ncbi:MAG: fimbria major subunit [Paramuribaculum sp.]|nr:fimbria major subunit [Paramuribaculum sp.]